MEDYFITCYKLETKTISDGLGGYETAENVGIDFQGLPVKKGEAEQLIGALRGNEQVQYNFHCGTEIPLKKDDKIMYVEKGEKRYIRLSSEAIINTDESTQTGWKSYNAESYTPTTILESGG